MPVLIARNIAVSHDTKESFKRLQSRRQSRLTTYLTTVNESQEEDISIFNETCVQNVLGEQQERKKVCQRFEKLRLVWKRYYKRDKTPQEALNELLTQRSTPKRKLRLNAPYLRNRSLGNESPDTYHIHSHTTALTLSSNITDSGNCKSDGSEHMKFKPNQISFRKNPNSESVLFNHLSDNEVFPPKGEDDTSSIDHQVNLSLYRHSKSIFNSKKATGHQEHNLFSYRSEKRRPIVRELSIDRKKSVENSSGKERSSLLDALKAIQHEREKFVPELKKRLDVDTILRAYLSEQCLELNLQGPEADELRRVYKSTILNQPLINNLIMKHPDMIPSRIFKDLVTYKEGFEAKPIYSPTVVKSSEGPWRQMCQKAFSSPCGSVLIELENDVPLYANFYKNLLQRRAETVKVEDSWLRDQKPNVIRDNLLHLTVNLRISRQNPGSTVRFDMLRIFAAAARNDRLLRQLALGVEGWLDQLIKGLVSPFKSVREETCQVLCFMTSFYPVMRELYLSKYFDVVQDLSLAIIRATDQYEDTFPEYYILLAHIIHYCPSRSIIECLIDRWTNFRCVGLILQWPRLLYYALRYWPDELLCIGNRFFGARVTKNLDIALQRPLTAKVCRRALYHLQVRLNNVSRLFTINYTKQSPHSSFMAVLND